MLRQTSDKRNGYLQTSCQNLKNARIKNLECIARYQKRSPAETYDEHMKQFQCA